MAKVVDVRDISEVSEIVFADRELGGVTIAHSITKNDTYFEETGALNININDDYENVIITSVEHARALIKALEYAISIGWVK